MGGAGGQAGNRHNLVVAQAVLPLGHRPGFLLAQHRGHAHDEIGDQAGAEKEIEPHAQDVHIGAFAMAHLRMGREEWKRPEVVEQAAVGQQGGAGYQPGVAPGQHRRGDHQGHDIVGDEGIVGPPAEVHQHRPAQHIDHELREELIVGDGPGPGATP